MNEQANKKLGKAKANLVIEQPFLAALVCGLPLVEDASIPTLGTDGKEIIYNPDFILSLPEKTVQWALCHEVYHCVFQHVNSNRRGGRDPKKWNVAGDFCINQLLETDMPGARWPHALFDPKLYERGGGTAEGVYALLPENAGQAGSGMEGFDELGDMPGDEAERAEAEAMWQVRVAQAASAAKMAGKLPAHIERFVDQLLNPKVPWEDVLRRFCMRQTRADRSFARPARRYLHQGLYMPGRFGVGMGDIVVAVDCSGSIDQEQLTRFATEMQSIKDDAAPFQMHVIYFADAVTKYDCFGEGEELQIVPGRTGGTAFSPIFREVEARDIHPDCCVVLTDLYCSDFGPKPDYPVLWVSTHADQAPWGEVIKMEG